MESQFRFNWHNLDFAIKATYSPSSEGDLIVHKYTVLEARWLDNGRWIEEETLELIMRFVAEQLPIRVQRALIQHLTEDDNGRTDTERY